MTTGVSRRLALALAALLCLLWTHPARADKATAESLFREGKRLMDAGQVDEACPKFQASMEAEPSVGAMLNLARCHELGGRIASAWAEYTEAATLARRTDQPEREKGAIEYAKKLEPLLSYLTVKVDERVDSMVVTRSGVEVPPGSYGVAVAVDPGPYEVEAKAPGREPFRTSIEVKPNGDRQQVVVPALTASAGGDEGAVTPEPTPGADQGGGGLSGMQVAGIVVGAVGVIGLGVGIGFGVVALGDEKKLSDKCPNKAMCAGAKERADDIKVKANVSTAGFVVGGVALATGVILLVAAPDDEAAAIVVPSVGPSSAGLTVAGRF